MGRLTCAGWAALAILAGGVVFWANVAIAAGVGRGGIEALGLSYGQVRLLIGWLMGFWVGIVLMSVLFVAYLERKERRERRGRRAWPS